MPRVIILALISYIASLSHNNPLHNISVRPPTNSFDTNQIQQDQSILLVIAFLFLVVMILVPNCLVCVVSLLYLLYVWQKEIIGITLSPPPPPRPPLWPSTISRSVGSIPLLLTPIILLLTLPAEEAEEEQTTNINDQMMRVMTTGSRRGWQDNMIIKLHVGILYNKRNHTMQ